MDMVEIEAKYLQAGDEILEIFIGGSGLWCTASTLNGVLPGKFLREDSYNGWPIYLCEGPAGDYKLLQDDRVRIRPRPAPVVIEVEPKDLQVGDKIVDSKAVGLDWWTVRVGPWVPYDVTALHADCFDYICLSAPGTIYYHVYERLKVERAGVAKASSAGMWNGRCAACGKGTYTGFLQIEHEGDRCGGSRD